MKNNGRPAETCIKNKEKVFYDCFKLNVSLSPALIQDSSNNVADSVFQESLEEIQAAEESA